jgi:D-glycero-alpha-D-manno-heptose-7-phosphate kinase
MIISKTPLRVSFAGGGTDLGEFCQKHGGAVVSSAIDKWVHVIVARRFERDVRVCYSRTEVVPDAGSVDHELVREALCVTGIHRGVDILTLADVPSRGTGLGSSSAVTVGLLNALYAFQGVYKSPVQLAAEASELEIGRLGKPIGRQDQYAAAVGGLNLIEFLPNGGGVQVEPLVCPRGTIPRIHRSLMLFFTGRQRSSADVLHKQGEAIRNGRAVRALESMRDLAYELRERLNAGETDALGETLHKNWELKRSLVDGVSTSDIDDWYAAAMDAGASGGKLLGAGAGGFLLVCASPEKHAGVRAALGELREVPFRFAARGTQITYLDEEITQ